MIFVQAEPCAHIGRRLDGEAGDDRLVERRGEASLGRPTRRRAPAYRRSASPAISREMRTIRRPGPGWSAVERSNVAIAPQLPRPLPFPLAPGFRLALSHADRVGECYVDRRSGGPNLDP